MDTTLYILFSLLILSLSGLLWTKICMRRCFLVRDFCVKILDEDLELGKAMILAGKSDEEIEAAQTYPKLPSFDKMVNKFWVKDLNKFIRK